MRTPKITVHGWTEDGPLYTIQHRIAGRRHRSALRRGEKVPDGITHYGNGDAADSSAPDSALIYAHGEIDVFAFNAGHVYEVELLVDGNAHAVLVDAREGIVVQEFGEGLEPIERRVLTEDEVAEVEDGNPRPQPSNVSDGAESQEPLEVTVETAAPDPEAIAAVVEDHLGDQSLLTPEALEALEAGGMTQADLAYDETAATAAALEAALTPGTPEHAAVVESLEQPAIAEGGVVTEPVAIAGEEPGHETVVPTFDPAGDPVDPDAPATPAAEDVDEPSSDSDYGGTIPDFEANASDIDDDALVGFALNDSRKGIRDAAEREIDRRTASGAAVGGDSATEDE